MYSLQDLGELRGVNELKKEQKECLQEEYYLELVEQFERLRGCKSEKKKPSIHKFQTRKEKDLHEEYASLSLTHY